jgi:hypothetical protein
MIPVIITDKLQAQIQILCSKIPRHEWSGTLFYEVTGEFGEPGFSITAKELYLQDIGSAAYTEYETGDPEFIQLLMKRADLREMRQGHIHSHNTMGVFFSGTDDDELLENSQFHNYYFSLIVNNANEMKAKVAFRAEVESDTTSQLRYRDTNGENRIKTVTQKTTTMYVYTYDCHISLPSVIMDMYADISRVEDKTRPGKTNYYPSGTTKTWNNGSLFQDNEAESETVVSYGTVDDEEVEASPAAKWANEQREEKKKVNGKPGRNDEKKESVLRESVDFLIRLVTVDPLRDGMLDDAIREAVDEVYRREDRDSYFRQISEQLPTIYKSSFPPLQHSAKHLSRALSDSVDLMDLYADSYPIFSRNMIDILNAYLKSVE